MDEQLLEANKIASEMLGCESVRVKGGVCMHLVSCSPVMHYEDPTECLQAFSIENPSDRDAVVQMLGEKYGIFFEFYPASHTDRIEQTNGWRFDSTMADYKSGWHDAYQDAVVAAVLAV